MAVYFTVFGVFVLVSNVPDPVGVAPRLKVELAPWVQLPVRVNTPETVTVPVLLLVIVLVEAGVTVPPKVILVEPARDWFAENAAFPVPVLNVVQLAVIPAAKLVTVANPDKSKLPVVQVTAPVKVLVPVALETAKVPPVSDVVPAKVMAYAPIVSVPLGTDNFPQVAVCPRLLVPVETSVVAELIDNVPAPVTAPVRLIVEAPVVVSLKIALAPAVNKKVMPPLAVMVPVLASRSASQLLESVVTFSMVIRPVAFKVPVPTCKSLA